MTFWSTKSEVMILSPIGRPKAVNPKNHSIKVRFDEDTNNALIAYCEKHKITRTEAIREGLRLLLRNEK